MIEARVLVTDTRSRPHFFEVTASNKAVLGNKVRRHIGKMEITLDKDETAMAFYETNTGQPRMEEISL